MFFIAYSIKGQVHVFAGRVKIVSHSSCRTSAIFKYFCPLELQNYTKTGVKRIINSFIFQNNFQFLPLHFLYFEKKCFKGFF